MFAVGSNSKLCKLSVLSGIFGNRFQQTVVDRVWHGLHDYSLELLPHHAPALQGRVLPQISKRDIFDPAHPTQVSPEPLPWRPWIKNRFVPYFKDVGNGFPRRRSIYEDQVAGLHLLSCRPVQVVAGI